MIPRFPVRFLLSGLIACSGLLGCAGANKHSTRAGAWQGAFVARVVSVQPGMDRAFVAHLRDCHTPVWNQLRKAGVISGMTVFRLSHADATVPETPPWHYLLLAELGPRAKPGHLLNAEEAADCSEASGDSLFIVLRTESLSCTPNSCHAVPQPTYEDAVDGIDYLIEFIGVEDSASSLRQYRDLMSDYFGPANGLLVERGLLHSFIALETTEVLSQAAAVPPWNQLHVSDGWDEDDGLDWDAIYEDLFRREFACDLDSVWSLLPPIRERPTNYSGRIIPDLCVR